MVHHSLIPSLPSLFAAFAAVISTMPATPPPTPPPASVAVPFSGDGIPAASSSSSQHFQQAARFQERLQRHRGSPELRRVPSTPTSLSNNFLPPPPPPPVPVTFNGRHYNHLPPHIATALAAMSLQPSSGPLPSAAIHSNNPPPPFSAPPPQPQRQHNAQLLPVSITSFFPPIIGLLNNIYRLLPPLLLLFLLLLALALALALLLALSLFLSLPLLLLLPPPLSRCMFSHPHNWLLHIELFLHTDSPLFSTLLPLQQPPCSHLFCIIAHRHQSHLSPPLPPLLHLLHHMPCLL